MRRLLGLLKWSGIAALVLIVLAAIPVVWIETQCVKPRRTDLVAYQPIVGKEHQRRFVDTFLTYPEWSIVHAYEDFAAVAKSEGESFYSYWKAVRDYWRGLCTIYGEASSHGEIATDMRAMLHIIGLSFSAEMLVKGNWENTVGLVSTALSTESDAVEDTHAHKVADDYAKFLVQTPWYEFPFGKALSELWALEFKWNNPVRSIERRIALSMEWGVKSVYAKGMAALAGLAPAELTMRSVVTAPNEQVLASEKGVVIVERLGEGRYVIETPRYRAFSDLTMRLARKGVEFVEIGGNTEILMSFVGNEGGPEQFKDFGRVVYRVGRQEIPGTYRDCVLAPVRRLSELLVTTYKYGDTITFEHAYDF